MNLLDLRAPTLFVVDEQGDLTLRNDTAPADRPLAVPMFVTWDDTDCRVAFRHDVDDGTRQLALDSIRQRWPFPHPDDMPDKQRLWDILADYWNGERSDAGPVWTVPASFPPGRRRRATEVVAVTADNAHVLGAAFPDDVNDIDYLQPCFAVVVDGQAVSLCQTVRRTARSLEAGVDTIPACRRRGYARAVVRAWGEAVARDGKVAFYSTSWSNEASCAVAASLGMKRVAVEFSVR